MEDKVLKNYNNPIEDFISKTSQEIADSFSADEKFKEKVQGTIKSMINENEIKTIDEEIGDINKIVNDEVEAKKIRLEIKNWQKNNPKEIENYKKEEFRHNFEKEIRKINLNLSQDQLNK